MDAAEQEQGHELLPASTLVPVQLKLKNAGWTEANCRVCHLRASSDRVEK
jgi:hypothetical protein